MRTFNQGVETLLDLRPGQDYRAVGGTFARNSVASYIDRYRRLRYVNAHVLRDDHWINGKRGWLLEGGATQICSQPQTPAAWTNFGSPTVTTGLTDPWGGSAAVMLTDADTGNRQGKTISVTFTNDGTKAVLFCVRAGTAPQLHLAVRDTTAGNIDRHAVLVTWPNGADSTPAVSTAAGSGKIDTPVDIVDADGNVWWLIGFTVDNVVAANNNLLYVVRNDNAVGAGTFYFAGANAWNRGVSGSWQPSSGHVRNRDDFLLPHGMVGGADYTVYCEGYALSTAHLPDASYTNTTWWGITRTNPDWGLQLRLNAGAANRRPQVCLLAPTGSGTQAVATENSSGKQIRSADPYVRAAVQVRGSTNPAAVALAVRYDDESTVWPTTYIAGDLSAAISAWTTPLMRVGGYDSNMVGVFLTRITIVPGLVDLDTIAFGIQEALVSPQGEMVHLVEMDFSSGPVYLTTAGQDLEWNSITWQAVGGLLEIGSVEESSDGKAQGMDLRMSGVNQTIIAILLAAQYRGRPVHIYRAYYNKANGKLFGDPILIHRGIQFAPYVIEEEHVRRGGTVRISTRLSGFLGITRYRGIQSNLVSHQHIHPGDTFFQHTASLGNLKIYWGVAAPADINRGGDGPIVRAPPAYGGF